MQRVSCYYVIILLLVGVASFSCSSGDRESSLPEREIPSTPENPKQDAPKLEITSPAEGATVTMTELVRGNS